MSNRTTGRWEAKINPNDDRTSEVHSGALCVASCGTGNEAYANANCIAIAVNSHDDLLRTVKELVNAIEMASNSTASRLVLPHTSQTIIDAKALIAKTEGGT